MTTGKPDGVALLRTLDNCFPETPGDIREGCAGCEYHEDCGSLAMISMPVRWVEDVREYLKEQTGKR